jgi:hypothetical protein
MHSRRHRWRGTGSLPEKTATAMPLHCRRCVNARSASFRRKVTDRGHVRSTGPRVEVDKFVDGENLRPENVAPRRV